MTALEFLRNDFQSSPEKPLPSLPSPTLTNPDMVLPNAPFDFPALPSPPRSDRRPPSPSYLRDQTNERPAIEVSTGKKERRGLMSRKMLLLRSRTGSGLQTNGHAQVPRSVPSDSDVASRPSTDYNSTYASSPTLQDLGNLAPEQPEQKRMSTSGSSFNSDELAGIPSFLAKYEHLEGNGAGDDFSDTDSPVPKKYGYSVSIEGGMDEKRRQQEEDEHNSAILSKRAEQILANAKKRLNLMEGNLRGARDLVTPLTAANLKRATSLGSSHHSSSSSRGRFVPNGYHYEPAAQQPTRTLHAQASSPTMGRDYQSHTRGFSETELPERPHTAFDNSSPNFARVGRIPVKASNTSWTPSLRGSRSYDSFGSKGMHERPLHSKGSPESNLEPLAEDDASHEAASARNSRIENDQHGLGIERSPSTTDDLREQMSSLKGKISTLKERAREDSLRRQSMQSLRTPSPFNNALSIAPEQFYTQAQTYGSPVLDTNAGVGSTSNSNSPATPQNAQRTWDRHHLSTGSRNAFAEQVQRTQQHGGAEMESSVSTGPQGQHAPETRPQTGPRHRRTPSGTAIIEPAADRYSHHQLVSSREMPGAYVQDDAYGEPSWDDEAGVSPLPVGESPTPDYDHEVSEEESSVYEDAAVEQAPVVAHEDRDDAFDYEHFFLHSAMGSYSNGKRHSTSSEDSASSAETARALATTAGEEGEDAFANPHSDSYPPPTPETPERLKEIERSLHKRTFSDDSINSVNTFATADEGLPSPTREFGRANSANWPIPAAENRSSRPNSRPNSRPSTAVKYHETARQRDNSSERADSGVGIPRRSAEAKRPAISIPKMPTTTVMSPPLSPKTVVLHDPATLAVNALINPDGRPLGLKDKALLFGLVESLRRVCQRLQDEDEAQYESRVLRRKLDEAKRVLDETADQRPRSNGR